MVLDFQSQDIFLILSDFGHFYFSSFKVKKKALMIVDVSVVFDHFPPLFALQNLLFLIANKHKMKETTIVVGCIFWIIVS